MKHSKLRPHLTPVLLTALAGGRLFDQQRDADQQAGLLPALCGSGNLICLEMLQAR